MNQNTIPEAIKRGATSLGIEFGSTRIKSTLIDWETHQPIAVGGHAWENRYEGGLWTYPMEEVWAGLQLAYAELSASVQAKYELPLQTVGSLGFSGMMHGYMPFDADGNLLTPFRTWRNTNTDVAATSLTDLFQFNIPHRWSIAHVYQAILDDEPHVHEISYLTTLAGFMHWQLTGERVVGVGEASGIFPIDSNLNDYDATLMATFDGLLAERGIGWRLGDILPKVLVAGEPAGTLTKAGAIRLDPSGDLQPGIPMCPPEGDAGTGMVATNSVAERTGNVSAGTSVFAMIVLEKALSKLHPEIDMVTTPSGRPVAMVHANTCTSDINAWVGLFDEFASIFGMEIDPSDLFGRLYSVALDGDADGGGLLAYNYVAGEPVTGLEEGRPLFTRLPESNFTLANFMRTHLYAAVGTLKLGMDILLGEEHVEIEQLLGHGGFFKTPLIGQQVMAAAMNTPVSVLETAGEGGAWGMALLAAYLSNRTFNQSLADYLTTRVFATQPIQTVAPDAEMVAGFERFMERYTAGLAIERAAVESFTLGTDHD